MFTRFSYLVLASDKGFTRPEAMTSFSEHRYSIDRGAFSHAVNFDAFGRYFRFLGGGSVSTTHYEVNSLQTFLGWSVTSSLAQTRYAFEQKLARPNTINAVSEMHEMFGPKMDQVAFCGGDHRPPGLGRYFGLLERQLLRAFESPGRS